MPKRSLAIASRSLGDEAGLGNFSDTLRAYPKEGAQRNDLCIFGIAPLSGYALAVRTLLVLTVALVTGCGGRGNKPNDASDVVMPTPPEANPLPVPMPPIARQEMSEELQRLWLRIEKAVEVRPPDPPDGDDVESIEMWAEGPFKTWVEERQSATDVALEATYALRARPSYEKAVGSALFGYMYEDMISGVRGAPIPRNIAEDAGLLEIYSTKLNSHLENYARLSARAYYVCLATLVKHGELQWAEWADYCDVRGGDVVETYDLVPPEPEL